jgi:hypothetical protein
LFTVGNQEWRKRKFHRGGRPTRQEIARKKALDEATSRKTREWAEMRASVLVAGIFGIHSRCPLCGKTT